MFDILSTVEATVTAAIVVALLAYATARTSRARLLVVSALAVWFVLVLMLGATRFLDAELGYGVPALGLAVALPVAALVVAFSAVPSMRDALMATPLPALVAVNVTRIIGVSFVVLYAEGNLPAPFAPSAGWGDIFVGATALPVAWALARWGSRVRALALAWNVIGFADLSAAILLGALSSPGPFQVFYGPPSSSLMTTLPWIIIPCFLVPLFLFIHVVVFARLLSGAKASPRAQGGLEAHMTRPA
jgi:hypothetical protein